MFKDEGPLIGTGVLFIVAIAVKNGGNMSSFLPLQDVGELQASSDDGGTFCARLHHVAVVASRLRSSWSRFSSGAVYMMSPWLGQGLNVLDPRSCFIEI